LKTGIKLAVFFICREEFYPFCRVMSLLKDFPKISCMANEFISYLLIKMADNTSRFNFLLYRTGVNYAAARGQLCGHPAPGHGLAGQH
jgi:hypothetical protein